jgi:hypothetical protein
MSFIRRNKNKPHQPSRSKLDAAISNILDQAVNVDSDKAPEQLRLLLIKENPLWKLPERRVARYLKRHLKARNRPEAADIEANEDEETVYTTASAVSTNTDLNRPSTAASLALTNSIPEDEVPKILDGSIEMTIEDTGKLITEDNNNSSFDAQLPTIEDEKVVPEEDDSPVIAVRDVTEVYEDKKDESDDGTICFGMPCVIS